MQSRGCVAAASLWFWMLTLRGAPPFSAIPHLEGSNLILDTHTQAARRPIVRSDLLAVYCSLGWGLFPKKVASKTCSYGMRGFPLENLSISSVDKLGPVLASIAPGHLEGRRNKPGGSPFGKKEPPLGLSPPSKSGTLSSFWG